MSNSREMRRLQAKWQQNSGWPQKLDWIEIHNIRGWAGQRIPFTFPIMAIVGENGSGKSTILQCAASVYAAPDQGKLEESWYASDFFPKTIWEDCKTAEIKFAVRQGDRQIEDAVRKPGERWRGNPSRPVRSVNYIDLRRIQPIAARVGYSKLAKDALKETMTTHFDKDRLQRFSQIMGRDFDSARMAITDADAKRSVPVLSQRGVAYSGYHSGSGETTIAEFIRVDPRQFGLVIIDEIETSLHPRAQRRLVRDLADLARERDLQIIISTHSPYVLAELPLEARLYLMTGHGGRQVMAGVSPEFAMTKMDEFPHPECEVYVEDDRALTLVREMIVFFAKSLIERCTLIPYGAANVGRALGMMAHQKRFPRPSCVFLDGDQSDAPGCILIPGGDAPERVVFGDLQDKGWLRVAERTGRDFSEVADACSQAMTLTDHHDWIKNAASRLVLQGDILWQAMCAEWVSACLDVTLGKKVIQPVSDLLLSNPTAISSPIVHLPLFEQARSAPGDQSQQPGRRLL